jgi:hypothetical protein
VNRLEDQMDGVTVSIEVSPEAAVLLRDPERRSAVGRLVSGMLRPGQGAPDPLAALIAEVKQDARAGGLTDAEIEAEFAAYNDESRL